MRATKSLLNAVQRYATTGITGLAPVQHPRPILLEKYNATLSVLSQMPATSIYRKATEALTKQRIAIVESTEDVNEIEQQVGSGLAEELINIAQDELSLAQKMSEWKPWEQLEDPAPARQWDTPHQRK